MSNQVSGTLTTNPSLEWIAYEDADPKYFPADYNSEKVRRVRFSFRFDDYPIPIEVEVDGDLAIEVNKNLKRGDRCTLNGIVQGEEPIRPYGISYDQKSGLDLLSLDSIEKKLVHLSNENHYEHILQIIENMARSMEQNPSVFSKMNEESLRSCFLVQLNGHYGGQATSETHNYRGKTDILIQINGENLCIIECKFWRGSKRFTEAIYQLLGYSSRG